MPTVHARGIDFYYEEYGQGPWLLFAHGLLSSIAFLPRFGERIEDVAARGVHVVAYDARGHGRSGYTTDRADYSWSSLADDMYAVIQAISLSPTSIYGGSMGAATAMVLAARHPEAVDKLILRAPPGIGRGLRAARFRFTGLAFLYRTLGPRLTGSLVALTPAARKERREHPGLDLRSFIGSQRRAAIVPAMRGLLNDESFSIELLGAIRHRTLVLAHDHDPIHPLSSAKLLRARMPNATLRVAPDAEYWVEHPAELSQVVADFVIEGRVPRGDDPTMAASVGG